MFYLHANVCNARQITENKINNMNITTGKAVHRPASGVKRPFLLRHNGVLLKLNLPGCKRAWPHNCLKKWSK
jgi:hypothetical protein